MTGPIETGQIETGRIEIGATAAEREFGPLTIRDFVRYAGASGDLNPIHYDLDFAHQAGYPTVFSQGMHQAALLATYATDWLGVTTLRRYQVRFRDQVWPGDSLSCSGVVTAVTDAGAQTLVTVELRAVTSAGKLALTGEADFEIPASRDLDDRVSPPPA